LGVNAVWLLPFGSALARRFGAWRFLAFFAVTAAAGAALHLATHAGEQFPMIGASAAISGTMAAAMRFAFQRGGPLGLLGRADASAYRVPAIPLRGVLSDARVVLFLAIWFGINILFGLGSLRLPAVITRLPGRRISAASRGLLLFLVRSEPAFSAIQRFCCNATLSQSNGAGLSSRICVLTEPADRRDRWLCPGHGPSRDSAVHDAYRRTIMRQGGCHER
jgi:hypothetical protein